MKAPPNQWEHKANSATQSYIKNYLSDKELLAQKDFNRAVEHAKSSAELSILGKIYLTKCAMERIVGQEVQCEKFTTMETVINNQELSSYKNFLQDKLQKTDIANLPNKYKTFANNYITKSYDKALKNVLETKDIVSMLLMATFIKEHLQKEDISKVIHLSSFYGYAHATKFWLQYKSEKYKDTNSKEILEILEE
jgi:hypothetical protein